jgi:hypothetical protein
VELLGVMDVCCRDSKSSWKFFFRVDDHVDFIPVHILFFDVIPSPACFWVIEVCWEDGTILDDGGDAEEFVGDELLDNLVEQTFEGVDADAFDEAAVASDVRVVFEP